MKRRLFLTTGCAALLALATALPAMAGSLPDEIVRQLRNQGFRNIRISRTWLGRTRILAFRGEIRREIVVNPRTGEILRDFSHEGNGAGLLEIGNSSGGRNNGSDEDGFDDGDDGHDDGGHGGNSGSSGNSGSGGGESGEGESGEGESGEGESGEGEGEGEGESDGGDD